MSANLFGKIEEVKEELKKRVSTIKEEDVEKLQKKAIEVIDLTTMILEGFKHNLQKKLDDKEKSRHVGEEDPNAVEEIKSEDSN